MIKYYSGLIASLIFVFLALSFLVTTDTQKAYYFSRIVNGDTIEVRDSNIILHSDVFLLEESTPRKVFTLFHKDYDNVSFFLYVDEAFIYPDNQSKDTFELLYSQEGCQIYRDYKDNDIFVVVINKKFEIVFSHSSELGDKVLCELVSVNYKQ